MIPSCNNASAAFVAFAVVGLDNLTLSIGVKDIEIGDPQPFLPSSRLVMVKCFLVQRHGSEKGGTCLYVRACDETAHR